MSQMVRARALVIGFILYIVSESVLLHSNREIFVVTVLSHVIRDLKYLVKVRANLSLSLSIRWKHEQDAIMAKRYELLPLLLSFIFRLRYMLQLK